MFREFRAEIVPLSEHDEYLKREPAWPDVLQSSVYYKTSAGASVVRANSGRTPGLVLSPIHPPCYYKLTLQQNRVNEVLS